MSFFIEQLHKKYLHYLANLVLAKTFEPIVLRGGKNKPTTTSALHESIREFQQHEKSASQPGWKIVWEEWNSKALGRQQWPASVTVDTEADLLHLLQKEKEVIGFKTVLADLLQWQPALQPWLAQQPLRVLKRAADWAGIRTVVDYLLAHEVHAYYLRNLPVPVHTKFIEQNKTDILGILQQLQPERFLKEEKDFETLIGVKVKPMVFTLRWLDAALAQQCGYPDEVAGITVTGLRNSQWPVSEIWLVENATNLYMLPDAPGAVAIWSHGAAVALLGEITLFQNTNLYYWGDMDEEGFKMLHDCRQMYPHTQSRYMDTGTLEKYKTEVVAHPAAYKNMLLPLLTAEEAAAYEQLAKIQGRLEQERVLYEG